MNAGRYRKKPVVIDAVEWDGTEAGLRPVFDLIGDFAKLPNHDGYVRPGVGYTPLSGTLDIPTLEGTMTASPGDWIVRGVKGECYPVKPDIFAATYEPEATTSAPVAESRFEPDGTLKKMGSRCKGCGMELRECIRHSDVESYDCPCCDACDHSADGPVADDQPTTRSSGVGTWGLSGHTKVLPRAADDAEQEPFYDVALKGWENYHALGQRAPGADLHDKGGFRECSARPCLWAAAQFSDDDVTEDEVDDTWTPKVKWAYDRGYKRGLAMGRVEASGSAPADAEVLVQFIRASGTCGPDGRLTDAYYMWAKDALTDEQKAVLAKYGIHPKDGTFSIRLSSPSQPHAHTEDCWNYNDPTRPYCVEGD